LFKPILVAHFALLEPDNLPLWIDCISFAASKDICVLLEVVKVFMNMPPVLQKLEQ